MRAACHRGELDRNRSRPPSQNPPSLPPRAGTAMVASDTRLVGRSPSVSSDDRPTPAARVSRARSQRRRSSAPRVFSYSVDAARRLLPPSTIARAGSHTPHAPGSDDFRAHRLRVGARPLAPGRAEALASPRLRPSVRPIRLSPWTAFLRSLSCRSVRPGKARDQSCLECVTVLRTRSARSSGSPRSQRLFGPSRRRIRLASSPRSRS